MNTHKYILYGAGEQGAVTAEIVEITGNEFLFFLDQDTSIKKKIGYDVFQQNDENLKLENCFYLISIGNNLIRKKIASENNMNYGVLKHPSSVISKRSKIEVGTVVMPGVCVNTAAIIGKHCILNTRCSIDHDCFLEDYVHISPGATLGGRVTVGEGTQIGIGASVLPGIKIGKWCMIGAGAVVTKNIPDGVIAVGVPAKII
jgi:acetyltransferase EpsM